MKTPSILRQISFAFLLCGLLSGVPSPSRGSTFWATYGGAGSLGASSIAKTLDGGYFVAGGLAPAGTGPTNAWILRLDGKGTVLWENTYGGASDDYINSVQSTPDDGCVVAGYTSSFGAGGYDAWVLKLDGQGAVLWQNAYGGAGYDFAASVQPTPDGGYLVAGGTDSWGTGQTEAWVFKLDQDGNVLWDTRFGDAGVESVSSIQITSDGGIVLAGGTQSSGAGDYDAVVIRLDGSGSMVWQKTYGGPDYDFASSVRETVDGGFVVVGETLSFGAGGYDLFVFKVDGTGKLLWQKTYGGTGDDSAHSVQTTADGGFVIVGGTRSSSTGDDVLVLRLDANGGLLWQKTYGGTENDFAHFVDETDDGGLVVAGETRSFGAGDYDFFVLKLDGSGALGGTCGAISKASSLKAGTPGFAAADGTLTPGAVAATVSATSIIPQATSAMTQACVFDINTLTLTAPNGGETWAAGSTQTIRWTYTGNPGTTVKIELIKGGGAPVSIIDSTPIGSSGSSSYTWTLPSALAAGADYRVKITAGAYSDVSAATFTVAPAPTLTLTSPNGGETWAAGSTQSITWTYTGNPGATVKVELIKAGGTPVTLAKSTTAGTGGSGSYAWKIPTTQAPGTDYRVQITSTTYSAATDISDADFTVDSTLILTAPNGGEKWTPGSTQTIKWTYTGNPGTTVKIELIKGGGTPASITDSTPIGSSGTGSYAWVLPSALAAGADYRVKVTAGACSDASAADFTVDSVPTLTLTAPNGGETWVAGSTQTITWAYTGNPGATVKVELIKAGGTPATLVKSTKTGTGGNGSYAWKIPTTQAPGTDYRVQITSTTYSTISDTSDADFTVDSTLTLTAPNGAEIWTAGSTQAIKWTYTGNPGATVKIDLIKGGGAPASIADSTPIGSSGSGSYAWPIPSALAAGADYRVKITAGTCTDTSAADFTVVPAPTLTLTSPNGGETWAAGSTQSITWTYTGNPGATVKVELIKAGGTPVTLVKSTTAGIGGGGSYAWKIPTTQAPGTDYRVKITSTTYSAVSDTSDADFTVDSTLSLVSPNGGETWTAGSAQTIKWTYTGNPGTTVKIQLIKPGYMPGTIADSTPIGSSGSGS
jgi:5-hydroxyisourate hydrolase-like protein (transthyretin family)